MSESPQSPQGEHADWSSVGDAFQSVADRIRQLAQESGDVATEEGSNVLDAFRDGLARAVETARAATQDTDVTDRLNSATSGLLDALAKELHISRDKQGELPSGEEGSSN